MNNLEFERAYAIYRASRVRFKMRVADREKFTEYFYAMPKGDQKICLEVWLELATRG